MRERVKKLRERSYEASPSISSERAVLETQFYKTNLGKHSVPVMRAAFFKYLCENQTLFIGEDELIVGERGPFPKNVPTYPELTCHSMDDLKTLNKREMTRYSVSKQVFKDYEEIVIPYWHERSLRSRIFSHFPDSWLSLYNAGVFTEFMEQRAPGHTALDGQIYSKGFNEVIHAIEEQLKALDFLTDPDAYLKKEELKAMKLSAEAIIRFAERHAKLALDMAKTEEDPDRSRELHRIAKVCARVPANAPRNLWEALQMYWFVHLGTIMELNGWDAMNPGHIDQHLAPFYQKEMKNATLNWDSAKELVECFLIKFNNQPAPPKVGITAAESGTYNDFTNLNLGGVKRDGSDGVSEISYLFLEAIEELHLLQPGNNVQISSVTPDQFLKRALKVIKKGYGYPSVFNTDEVIEEMLNAGKRLEDAREGGCSGCIETGAFGKEAYILTGYLNVPKILEIVMNNGVDPLTGKQIGIKTGNPEAFRTFDELYAAFEKQLKYVVDEKIMVNNLLERIYSTEIAAPFLSTVIKDCIKKGRDYYNSGPRYNTNYIQCCGIGTITDSLSALNEYVYKTARFRMPEIRTAIKVNYDGFEPMRSYIRNKTPFFGNDDDRADVIMKRVFDSLYNVINNRSSTKGKTYRINMLSTTCHVYFGKMLGATPDGRLAHQPESDGTSPSHGADRNGPTAVLKSLMKIPQTKTGGTLLNQKLMPGLLKTETDIDKLVSLIRTYFRYNGHHVQFNIVDSELLKEAQKDPVSYKDLLVRVAGYSDYFVDLDRDHQNEIISRTLQESW